MLLIWFLIGLFTGIIGAILGLGGGIIIVPALQMVAIFGHDIAIVNAIAISHIAVLASGISASNKYLKQNIVKSDLAYTLTPFAILGAIVGSLTGAYLNPKIVSGIFALLLFYSASRIGKKNHVGSKGSRHKLKAAIGFSGFASGLLGIGGGTLQVPLLDRWTNLDLKSSIATSTFIMSFSAAISILIYTSKDLVDYKIAGLIGLGVLFGANLGTKIQQQLSLSFIKKAFVILLLFSACQILYKNFFIVL